MTKLYPVARALTRPALLVVVAAMVVAIGPRPDVGYWLWALAIPLLGMPHGAYDLAAMVRESNGERRRVAVTFAWYTAIIIGVVALFVFEPWAAIVGFFVLAMHHFGVSDCVRTRGRARLVLRDHLAGFAHGAAVLGAALMFHPEAAIAPFEQMARAAGAVEPATPELVALCGSVACWGGIAGVCVVAITLYGRGRPLAGAEQLATVFAVFVLAAVAPPLITVAAYFLIVHAAGHCGRAVTPGRPEHRRPLRNALRVHVESLPLLIPSVAIVVAMAGWWLGGVTVATLAIAFLLFCVFTTLPHHLLWLDVLHARPRHTPPVVAS